MLGSKKFEKIIVWLVIMALVFSLVIVCFPNIFSRISKDRIEEEYPVKIFEKDVVNIKITADENDWNGMLENRMSKPYISCDIEIDGKEFKNVGLRPKGNSSLTSIQGDRISYRLDFDHYIDNQTCYGLEQMALNNLQADATYMKDYIAYDLMAYEGVNAPLHTFAFITINEQPFGVYLAVEVYDEDYLSRVYDDINIELYNVKNSGMDEFENAIVDPETGTVIESQGVGEVMNMGGPGGPPPQGGPMPPGGQSPMPPPNGQVPDAVGMRAPNEENIPQPPPGSESGGGDLVYVDDSTESYSAIFANAVSKRANAEDFARVIRAIKYLNKENVSNEELEQYWDIDAVLRYLAVHAFMVNGDSYTGNMMQNYFLAERDGKITILPWDYNLSFGAFGGGPGGAPPEMQIDSDKIVGSDVETAQVNNETIEAINHPIDTPTIGVSMESRPLVSVLLSRDDYKEKYHQYLDELTIYASGDFINKLEAVEKAIYPYIERETVSFFTPEEHKEAFKVLKDFLELRCRSIQCQLNGEIPSELELQNGADLITADFSISEMGSMGGPGDMLPGENGEGAMAPPQPPNDDGQGGMVPPPGMSGTMQNESNNDITIAIALVILCIMFIGVKLFKRNY